MENFTNEISSLAVGSQANPDMGYKDIFWHLEQKIGEDVGRVKDFVQKGIITQDQGQYLYGLLVQKAQELNNYKLAQQQNVQNSQTPVTEQAVPPQENPFEQFSKERPGFFDGDGRMAVLDYIKGYSPDKDEILKIAQLVEKLENSAVDKFMKKSEYEKSLNDENAAAKSKLTAYAQNSASDGGIGKVFTREEIGKMSGKEFDRNEEAIMAQLRSGLIR
jgi:hypothetical protein